VLAIPQPEEHHTVITVAAGANKVAGPGAELVRMSQIACTSSHQTPSASASVDAEGDQQPVVLDVPMSIPSTTSTLATLVLPMTDGLCTALELLARNLTDNGLRDWRPVRHHVFLVLVRLISVGKGLQQPGSLGPEP
jgi:hypothetical protein